MADHEVERQAVVAGRQVANLRDLPKLGMRRGKRRTGPSMRSTRCTTSPAVLGREITARPVLPRRVPNPDRVGDENAPKTVVVRKPEAGAMSQAELASWPQCRRPDEYYREG